MQCSQAHCDTAVLTYMSTAVAHLPVALLSQRRYPADQARVYAGYGSAQRSYGIVLWQVGWPRRWLLQRQLNEQVQLHVIPFHIQL
jgi:hypothetical protein